MIQLYSYFYFVSVPIQNTEFSIYTRDYYIDKEGVIFDEMPHGDVYEYGDLIIETPTAKYIFRRVYSAYQYCADIIRKINEQKMQPIISINLDEAFNMREFRAEGGFEITPKRCAILNETPSVQGLYS